MFMCYPILNSSEISPEIESCYSQQKKKKKSTTTKRPTAPWTTRRQQGKCGTTLVFFGFVLWSIYSSTACFSALNISLARDEERSSIHNKETSHSSSKLLPPIHVAFGLSGNDSGFLSEFQVALKSVLLQAPMERDLYIHVLADAEAYAGLRDQLLLYQKLCSWRTRNAVHLQVYNVTSQLPWLHQEIVTTLANFNNQSNDHNIFQQATGAHTIGTFFRLIAHRVIQNIVSEEGGQQQQHVLYLDTDVILMTNLEALWQEVESSSSPDTASTTLFHWGSSMTAGFVVMDLSRIGDIWKLVQNVSSSEITKISERFQHQKPNDQLLYQVVNATHPELVHILSDGWDMHATAKWQSKHRPYDVKYPNLGMLHYNGGGSSKEAYWRKGHDFLDRNSKLFNDTWAQGWYTIQLPWTWARFQAQSLIRPYTNGTAMTISILPNNNSSAADLPSASPLSVRIDVCQKILQEEEEKERSSKYPNDTETTTFATSNSTTETPSQVENS